jgi:hypothetical protein
MSDSIEKKSCAVLVPSCDPYSDLWKPFFTLFFRFWDSCPYPIFLGSNKLSFDHPRVKMVFSDQGINWSNRVREQIKKTEAEYIILFLEDFFLQSKIQQEDIDYCLSFLIRENGHCIRMIRWPGPTNHIQGNNKIGSIKTGTPYRVSTQVAIWKKSSLLELMQRDESIWQFEIDGSKRSDRIQPDGFYCTWKDIMTYKHHVIEKGKWFPWDARKFKKMNIGCDFSKREIMTRREAYKWRKAVFIASALRLIPVSIRRKMGKSYAEMPNI